VAGEVRVLAQRSAESAKEIKGLIDNAVAQVEIGVAKVHEAGTTMTEIVSGVAHVRDQLTAMSGALSQQSLGVGHVNEAVSHIDKVTQENASFVDQTASAASDLADGVRQLRAMVDEFKV
jgi:methyl-accepting chemotaxis protein